MKGLYRDENDIFDRFPIDLPITIRALGRYDLGRRLASLTLASTGKCGWPTWQVQGIRDDTRLSNSNEIRQRVIRGWMNWQDLADISKEIRSRPISISKNPYRLIRTYLSHGSDTNKRIKKEILRHWLAHTASFSKDELSELLASEHSLEAVIKADGTKAVKSGVPPLWSEVKGDRVEPDAVQWLAGFMIRQGPKFIINFLSEQVTARTRAQAHLLQEIRKGPRTTIIAEQSEDLWVFLYHIRERIEPDGR